MRRKLVFLLASLSLATAVHAQTFREWQDPGVNAVNRAPMHTHYFAYENEGLALAGCPAATLPPDILWKVAGHPLTEEGVDGFIRDWESVYGKGVKVTDLPDSKGKKKASARK